LAACSEFGADYLQRLLDGDRETERHFAGHFGRLLDVKLKYTLRMTQEAEDLRQETLMRVLVTIRRDGLDRPERLAAFVNAVCNNVLFEFYRRDSHNPPAPETAPDLPDNHPIADERIIDEQRRKAVHRVLDSLPGKDCELLRRVFFDEEDKEIVCRDMNVSRSYLRVLLFRARVKFRKTLDQGKKSG